MDNFEILANIGKLKKRIAMERLRVESYREAALAPATRDYTKVGSSSKGKVAFEELMAIVDEREREIQALTEQLNALIISVTLAIERLDSEEERTVLTMRYIQGASWTEMVRSLNVTERTLFRWHRAGVKNLKVVT